jgi:hypothetical protein
LQATFLVLAARRRPPDRRAGQVRRGATPGPRTAECGAEAGEERRPHGSAGVLGGPPRGDRPTAGPLPGGRRAVLPRGPEHRRSGPTDRLPQGHGPVPPVAGAGAAARATGPQGPGAVLGPARNGLEADRPGGIAETLARCRGRRFPDLRRAAGDRGCLGLRLRHADGARERSAPRHDDLEADDPGDGPPSSAPS